MTQAAVAVTALLLDRLLGEPRRFHPLVGFGRLASWLEQRLYGPPDAPPWQRRLRGALAVATLVLPFALLAALPGGIAGLVVQVIALYVAIGERSLAEHARAVARALEAGDLARARAQVARLVSRDTHALDEHGIARAATESVLENGNDAVFGALLWFLLAGAPGVVAYRLANTLDAMWGYRNARYHDFGWAAARLDDVLNYLPARLTALTYAVLGDARRALACWHTQARHWDSPNAGPVMAAGAGALGLVLGGPARYHGEWRSRALLGEGRAPITADIPRAIQLVRLGLGLWLIVIVLATAVHGFFL
jgi:adenosylcobinamide-phosphate synthase